MIEKCTSTRARNHHKAREAHIKKMVRYGPDSFIFRPQNQKKVNPDLFHKNMVRKVYMAKIYGPYQLFYRSGPIFIFFQACERAESSKRCNLIGSESGQYLTILPTNPGGIVGSFIHNFRMSKKRHFQTIFLLKLALLLALAREK